MLLLRNRRVGRLARKLDQAAKDTFATSVDKRFKQLQILLCFEKQNNYKH